MAGSEWFFKIGIRAAALTLCLLAAQKSWAGISFYRGQRAFQQMKFGEASLHFEKALKWDPGNPRLLLLEGQSALRLGREKAAVSHLEKLARELPHYGRAWLHLGLARLSLQQKTSGKISRMEWKQNLEPLFEKAYQRETGSAWIAFLTGRILLEHASDWAPERKEEALERIRKSAAFHYPDQASPNLRPALTFLWKQFSDFDLLMKITPADAVSYAVLMEWIEGEGLWSYRDSIVPDWTRLNQTAYENQFRTAEKFLKARNFRRAFLEFQKAFWLDKISIQARAGMLIAQERLNQTPSDFQEPLREILEEEEEEIENLMEDIGPLVKKSGDPYLAGLYAFRKNEFSVAVGEFEKSGPSATHRFRRRYGAAGLWEIGEKDKALETLRPALEEKDVDLRELALLESWDSPYREETSRKIEELATVQLPAEKWWGWGKDVKGLRGRLGQRARMGMELNLKPGKVRVSLSLRSTPDGKGSYGYLLFRLMDKQKERRIGAAYLPYPEWKDVILEFETSGGKRWLEAELLNGREEPDGPPGPVVEFGALRIDYGS